MPRLILFEISIGREGIFECLHESKYPVLGPLVMDLYLLVVVVLLRILPGTVSRDDRQDCR